MNYDPTVYKPKLRLDPQGLLMLDSESPELATQDSSLQLAGPTDELSNGKPLAFDLQKDISSRLGLDVEGDKLMLRPSLSPSAAQAMEATTLPAGLPARPSELPATAAAAPTLAVDEETGKLKLLEDEMKRFDNKLSEARMKDEETQKYLPALNAFSQATGYATGKDFKPYVPESEVAKVSGEQKIRDDLYRNLREKHGIVDPLQQKLRKAQLTKLESEEDYDKQTRDTQSQISKVERNAYNAYVRRNPNTGLELASPDVNAAELRMKTGGRSWSDVNDADVKFKTSEQRAREQAALQREQFALLRQDKEQAKRIAEEERTNKRNDKANEEISKVSVRLEDVSDLTENLKTVEGYAAKADEYLSPAGAAVRTGLGTTEAGKKALAMWDSWKSNSPDYANLDSSRKRVLASFKRIMSGASVSEQEARDLSDASGLGTAASPEQFRQGVAKLAADAKRKVRETVKSMSPDAQGAWLQRYPEIAAWAGIGGVVGNTGVQIQSAPAANSKPQPPAAKPGKSRYYDKKGNKWVYADPGQSDPNYEELK